MLRPRAKTTRCSHFIIIATRAISAASGNPIVTGMRTPQIKAIAASGENRAAATARTLCPASLGNRNKREQSASKWLITKSACSPRQRRKGIICPQVLEPQHGGTYPPKRCSTHQDDVSHTLNRQTAPKTTKSWWRIQQVPFYTFGYLPRTSRATWTNRIGVVYTCFRYRSRRQRSPKCPLGLSVEFPRRGNIYLSNFHVQKWPRSESGLC